MTTPTKIGRYEITDRVGRGGMGAVYRGRDPVLEREVAVKVMSSDFAADETARPRFYREAKAAAKLQHRNIVTIFEFGEEGDTPFIVMEFLRGQDLSKRIRSEPPLTLGQKIDIVAELCAGLHFAHEQGVVHRDVKPANIWLVPDGSVKLLDFGIATLSSSTVTGQGPVLGSVSYMPPEQLAGGEVDGRADIFAAGVVLYELLSGRKPFTGDTPTAVLARIMDDQPASVADLPLDLPQALIAAVMKALEKDKPRRYRHAGEFAADLRAVRGLLAGGGAAAEIDLAETTYHEPALATFDESGRPQPAGAVNVARTVTLPAPSSAPVSWPPGASPQRSPAQGLSPAQRTRWLPLLLAAIVVALGTGWYFLSRASVRPQPASPTAAPVASKSPIEIRSEPAGARIAVNDEDTGRVTPSSIEVEAAQLPRLTLTLPGRPAATAVLTADDLRKGSIVLHLEPAVVEEPATAGSPPPPPAPPAAPAPAPAKTTVVMTGDYPFEIVEAGRVISPAQESHEVVVTGRPRLFIRKTEYFLNQPVRVDGSDRFEWQAPALGRLQLLARETCLVTIAGRNLGEPPILQLMAAGSYTAEVACGGQPPKRETFTISAGETSKITVR